MFSSFKLEKALAAMVLLTLIAVVAERNVLKVTKVIDHDSGLAATVYDDRVNGGATRSAFLDRDKFKWSCDLEQKVQYPFCGFELIFDPAREKGIDLSNFTKVRIWLDYKGPGRTIRIYLRNFDLAYSVPGFNATTKYNQIEFDAALLRDGPIEFNMSDFFVANWWLHQLNVHPEFSHPQFDNIVVFEVQTGNNSPRGHYELQLQRIEFTGHRLSTQRWYQFILGAWLVIALLFLAARILWLNRELKRRKRREQELLEVNQLLDMRGQQLEEIAKTDPLTGAFNRQGIEDAIKTGLLEWRRSRKPLSIIMLDVDHFKKVNDTYGHAVGDSVLTGIVDLVQRNVRAGDMFARWGGEEFVLVCRDTTASDARLLAEKLRSLIAAASFSHGVEITVSMGVAMLGGEETLDQLFIRADMSLYDAKKSGRNRVILAS